MADLQVDLAAQDATVDFSILPEGVLTLIFLNAHLRPQDLAALRNVCKEWRQIIDSAVVKITLRDWYDFPNSVDPRALSRHFCNLRHLDISCLDDRWARQANLRPRLRRLLSDLVHLPRLRRLDLSGAFLRGMRRFGYTAEQLPQVQADANAFTQQQMQAIFHDLFQVPAAQPVNPLVDLPYPLLVSWLEMEASIVPVPLLLPEDIAALQFLEHIHVTVPPRQYIAGTVPPREQIEDPLVLTTSLPPSLHVAMFTRTKMQRWPAQLQEAADRLTVLGLHGNSLREVPDAVASFTQLEQLILSYNNLTDLPDALSQLAPCLQLLNLSRNNLEALPACITTLTSLKVLDISINKLTPGSIPDGLSALTQLEILDVSSCWLLTLPACMMELQNVKVLNVSDNKLFMLPDSVSRLTRLLLLKASGNELHGQHALPVGLSQLSQLQYLDLADCAIRQLPEHFCMEHPEHSMRSLNLKGNKLLHVPQCLSRMPHLLVLNLRGNRMRQLDVQLLGSCRKLRWLDVGLNLVQDLPEDLLASLAMLPLRVFDVSGNLFSSVGAQARQELEAHAAVVQFKAQKPGCHLHVCMTRSGPQDKAEGYPSMADILDDHVPDTFNGRLKWAFTSFSGKDTHDQLPQAAEQAMGALLEQQPPWPAHHELDDPLVALDTPPGLLALRAFLDFHGHNDPIFAQLPPWRQAEVQALESVRGFEAEGPLRQVYQYAHDRCVELQMWLLGEAVFG